VNKVTCPVCRKRFASCEELISHLERTHPRSLLRIYLAELDVDETERELILRAIRQFEKRMRERRGQQIS